MRKAFNYLSLIGLLALAFYLAPAVLAKEEVVCDSEVVVQTYDSLSKLADKLYGDALAYQAIVDATNAKNAIDSSYAKIEQVDLIEPGWKLCIPPADVAQTVDMKIQNAMSAAPVAIAKDATIMDFSTTAGRAFVELRQGTNGWTCFTDWPGSPGNDPMCLDKTFLQWYEAVATGTELDITTPGLAYMLQGGSDPSTTDPLGLTPLPDGDWVSTPPHIMLLFPDKFDGPLFSTDPHYDGPYVKWTGTPYEHIIIPIKSEVR